MKICDGTVCVVLLLLHSEEGLPYVLQILCFYIDDAWQIIKNLGC